MNQPVPPTPPKRRFDSGFGSVREMLSYAIGGFALYYGIVEAQPGSQLIVVGAGLTLMGLPVIGSIFGKKEE